MITIETVAAHHAVTSHTPLADIVIACICTPGVQRDADAWARHLIATLLAAESSDASVSVGHGLVEEAGPCRVIPINRT